MIDNAAALQQIPLSWAYRLLGYGPLVMVSTTDGETPDVSTVAWARPCRKDPPRFSLTIGTGHRTWKNLAKTGILGINVPTAAIGELALYCGTCSGDDVDKVSERGLELRRGTELTDLPLLEACAAWIECRVTPKSLAEGSSRVEVDALAATCRPGVLTPDHCWNVEDFPTLHHLGGKRFLVGSSVVDL